MKRYVILASMVAGVCLAATGGALLIKAFFTDALSSYAYGITGLLSAGVGVILLIAAKSVNE
jgi:hypothetical protein